MDSDVANMKYVAFCHIFLRYSIDSVLRTMHMVKAKPCCLCHKVTIILFLTVFIIVMTYKLKGRFNVRA